MCQLDFGRNIDEMTVKTGEMCYFCADTLTELSLQLAIEVGSFWCS